ncbi:hypothetical protein [Luteithermobacter gelatinilyticus]|uniref:hypothetical protein n=1 Tax=Luteithermobacter gelatinilyticus TaxID=2582913 RepID=UPI0011071FEA|nr:hypothetical protein [Luteithermobacter gelatinilyticus]
MGGYLLVFGQNGPLSPSPTVPEKCLDVMNRAGFATPKQLTLPGLSLYYYDKLTSPGSTLFETDTGDFCFSVGTLFYKGSYGRRASERLYKEFDPERLLPETLDGSFTAFVYKGGRLYMFSDPLGTYRQYHTADHRVWSSSFLVTVAAAKRLTPLPQAIYEYVFQGATYGRDTPFQEIHMTCGEKLYEWNLTAPSPSPVIRNRPFSLPREAGALSRQDALAACTERLQTQFTTLVEHFGDRIDTALSGGYDSRLMLALLFQAGARPHIHVYGRDQDPDVQVAKAIARGEGFPLSHTDKSHAPRPAPETYRELVERNFYVMDGLPNEGLFDNGQNIETRRERVEHGKLALNGGGGEIFRDFFHLPDRSFEDRDVVRSFYSQYDTQDITNIFQEDTYRATLAAKIRAALGVKQTRLTRTEVEAVYPCFRLRYWMGRNTSLNNRFGPALTPFTDYQLLKYALQVPLQDKYHGDFEAALIRRISPTLAVYSSDYGYDFTGPAPFRARLRNRLDIHRPIFIRERSFALKNRLRPHPRPCYLDPTYAGQMVDLSAPVMADYFNLKRLHHPEQLNRVYSLELVMRFARTKNV